VIGGWGLGKGGCEEFCISVHLYFCLSISSYVCISVCFKNKALEGDSSRMSYFMLYRTTTYFYRFVLRTTYDSQSFGRLFLSLSFKLVVTAIYYY
jgi:hypothetical protein